MINKWNPKRKILGMAKKGIPSEWNSISFNCNEHNAIGTNCVKAKYITEQNCKCRLCCDIETKSINHMIINECTKLAEKEYKTNLDWVGKMINWELCKKLKFEHTNKWYMHNSESVLENETHQVFRNFEKKTDHLNSARLPDLTIVKNK